MKKKITQVGAGLGILGTGRGSLTTTLRSKEIKGTSSKQSSKADVYM